MSIVLSLSRSDKIRDVLAKAESLWRAREKRLHVDLSGCTYAYPHHLMLLACMVNLVRLQGHIVDVRVTKPEDSDVARYVSRIDFYKALGQRMNEDFRRHSSTGRFLEITRVTPENQGDAITHLSKVITENFNVPRATLASIHYSLVEMISNIDTHAESRIDGWICAQNYADRVDLCIVDGGVGIRETLRRNPEYLTVTSEEALTLAVRKQVTRDPKREEGQGMGLYATSQMLQYNQGSFVLTSGAATLLINKGKQRLLQSPHWPGTIVFMRFLKNDRLTEDSLRKIWEGNLTPLIEDALYDGVLW